MEFQASVSTVVSQKTDCVVVTAYDDGSFGRAGTAVDEACRGVLQKLFKNGDLKGKPGEYALLPQLPGCSAERVLVVGVGNKGNLKAADFRKVVQTAANVIKQTGSKSAHLYLIDLDVPSFDETWKAQQCGILFAEAVYQINALKSEKKPAPSLNKLCYCVIERKQADVIKAALAVANAIAEGMALTKNLGNLPANVCTPTYLGKEAKKLGNAKNKITTQVLGEKQMAELKMGSLLSVAAGSKEPAQLIVMEYKGGKKSEAPTVLVGKGITFDTGGISLKPGLNMDEMKFDMCGAATVFGAMKALSVLQPKINVVGIVAASENMPSGKATKPGDIVTSMSGRTIEILNTDAEGRLVLCDALTYAERYKPKAVIDIATLTGACIVALGSQACGLYSNNPELGERLRAAGDYAYDRAWPMPLFDEYKQQLDSNFADLANIGGPKAGSVTAACFLSYFAENYPWAHMDIAGVAHVSGNEKSATGRPVPLLMNYLLQHG